MIFFYRSHFAYSAYAFIAALFGLGLVYLYHHSVGCVLSSAKDLSVGFIVLPAPATRIPPPVTTSSGLHRAIAKSVPPLVRLPKRQGIPLRG
jgi:hypothetical protein